MDFRFTILMEAVKGPSLSAPDCDLPQASCNAQAGQHIMHLIDMPRKRSLMPSIYVNKLAKS